MEETGLYDPLNRFLRRQKDMYDIALRELTEGKKKSHWIWYIFPQLRGLGQSRKSYVFGIADLEEARAYLAHPVLGERLVACCRMLLTHSGKSAEEILGELDAMKLRSSMTLFCLVGGENSVFQEVLDRFYDGKPDWKTIALLKLRQAV